VAALKTRPTSKKRASGRKVTLLDAAAALLAHVLRFDGPADATMGRFFRDDRRWGSRDRELIGDVVHGVLRRWATMREAVGVDSSMKLGLAESPRLALLAWPDVRLDKLTLEPRTAAWLTTARERHRELMAGPRGHDLPAWLAQRLRVQEGEGFAALAASLLEPAPLDLRVNTLKASRDEVRRALALAGIDSAPARWSPWGLRVQGKPSLVSLDVWKDGLFEVQDEGSQLLAWLVDARRGEMVADFCAGGGGKTLALGAAMANTGRLYAIDTSASRLAALAPRLARSGLRNVYTMAIDDQADPRLDRLAGKMDRVLVDAPCTGLGTLRRHPDLKWRVHERDMAAMTERQVSILSAASWLVKPRGLLVYATCSVLDEENQAVVNRFLEANPRFTREDLGAAIDRLGATSAGLVQGGALRLLPHLHGTDGFFATTLRRED
jgi:16S rRNA (cytosine967-C5)-methyltransferase